MMQSPIINTAPLSPPLECDSGLRLEGLLGTAIIVAVQTAITAPFAGGYDASILKLGLVDVQGLVPNASVLSFMSGAFYLTDIIVATAFVVFLPFVDIEKKLPTINATLRQREKDAALARGEEWVEPDELDRREQEEAERRHEEDRIKDLKEYCDRKGLDFETENLKYLKKQKKK